MDRRYRMDRRIQDGLEEIGLLGGYRMDRLLQDG